MDIPAIDLDTQEVIENRYLVLQDKIEKLKKERIKDILPSIAVEDRAWMEEKFKIIYYPPISYFIETSEMPPVFIQVALINQWKIF